jgi:hypothetical protein
MGKRRAAYSILVGIPERDYVENLSVNERIILKFVPQSL